MRRAAEPTYYEIAVEHQDGRRFLLCYSTRKSAAALARIIRRRWDQVIALTGVAQWFPAERAAGGYQAGGWLIRYSGRTLHQTKSEGELPYASLSRSLRS